MMTLAELFMGSMHQLRWYINEGLLTRRFHPTLPYAILNYTQKCQYDQHWDLVTRKCRGLIYRLEDGGVLARPFEKFFNLNDPKGPELVFDTPGTAYDKLDGSLGILYPSVDGYSVATRGSFESDQAKWATQHWAEHYRDIFTPQDRFTYLFEIIYPGNRIVLDYGNTEGLFLLAVIDNFTGMFVHDVEWPGPRVGVVAENITLEETMKLPDRDNKEGVVWRQWGAPVQVKLKQVDYVEKHKIVFGLNARAVWEMLSTDAVYDSGLAWESFIDSLPEEFRSWAIDVGEVLSKQHQEISDIAYAAYNDIIARLPKNYSRKEFALQTTQSGQRTEVEHQLDFYGLSPAVLFMILDGRSIREYIWKVIYPSADWRPATAWQPTTGSDE